jgi:hypothetical protein
MALYHLTVPDSSTAAPRTQAADCREIGLIHQHAAATPLQRAALEGRLSSSHLIEEVRFASDSVLEEDGFEPSVPPREKTGAFKDLCPRDE